MAKVKVDTQLFWDNTTGEARLGYRHPATHAVVFDDADHVEVDDERFEEVRAADAPPVAAAPAQEADEE